MRGQDTLQQSRQATPAQIREALMAQVVQEMRAPLSAIAGLAETLMDRVDSQQAHLAALIAQSSEQLVRRLDRMLEDAVLEATLRPDDEPLSKG
jgi:signal transduction histidine kinase